MQNETHLSPTSYCLNILSLQAFGQLHKSLNKYLIFTKYTPATCPIVKLLYLNKNFGHLHNLCNRYLIFAKYIYHINILNITRFNY